MLVHAVLINVGPVVHDMLLTLTRIRMPSGGAALFYDGVPLRIWSDGLRHAPANHQYDRERTDAPLYRTHHHLPTTVATSCRQR
jgi:hypothetical protein